MKIRSVKSAPSIAAGCFAVSFATTLFVPHVQAAHWDWIGKGGGATSYFDDTACWHNAGSLAFANDAHYISTDRRAFADGWDGTVTFRTATALLGGLVDNYAGGPVVFAAEAPAHGISSAGSFQMYNGSELTLASGTYSFPNVLLVSVDGKGCLLRVNGGALKTTSCLFVGYAGNADVARMEVNGGIVTVHQWLGIGEHSSGELVINGGMVTNVTQYATIGGNNPSVMTVRKGGRYGYLPTSKHGMIIGNNAAGTLNIDGGDVFVGGKIWCCFYQKTTDNSATITITDGGVLTMGELVYGSGTFPSTVTVDGGTIRAYYDSTTFIPAYENLALRVGDAGATIDTAGHAVTIAEDIGDLPLAVGHVAFTGGGTVTLTGGANYTGPTTVEAGTLLVVDTADKVRNILTRGGFVARIPDGGVADGTAFLTFTGEGTIESSLIDETCAVSGAAGADARLALSADGKSIVIRSALPALTWTGGSAGSTWATGARWTDGLAALDWTDGTNALFAADGDSACVDSAVMAGRVMFRQNATVSGSSPLTVSTVDVADGMTAAITAPTEGPLLKTGAGTLTLGASRTARTTLREGTLAMTPGATVEPSALRLGAFADRPVTFDYGGQTLAVSPGTLLATGSDVTLANGTFGVAGEKETVLPGSILRIADDAVFRNGKLLKVATVANGRAEIRKTSGDWAFANHIYLGNAAGACGIFRQDGGTVSANYVFVGSTGGSGSSLLEINGGTFSASGYFSIGENSGIPLSRVVINGGLVTNTAYYVTVGGKSPGALTVRTGGRYGCAAENEGRGLSVGAGSSGTLAIEGGDVYVGTSLHVCDRDASVSATIDVTDGGVLSFRNLKYGSLQKKGLGQPALVTVDNGTIRASARSLYGDFLPAYPYLTVVVGPGGATVDNAGHDIVIGEDLTGSGDVTFTGSGTTTLSGAQSGSGTASVASGTYLALSPGVTLARKLSIAAGATLALPGSGTVTLAGGLVLPTGAALTLAEGAALAFPLETADFPCSVLVSASGIVVEVSGDEKPADGYYRLPLGGGFIGKTVSLAAGAPDWVRCAFVDADGDLVIRVYPEGTVVILR